ncbi:MAG TPA: MoaD/ThiS family protein [Anaerolineales bacterium]|nr:MoaD/ThiS family protein [Anaerolineales bacterium]
MADMVIDVWLYGELARYGGKGKRGSHANPKVKLAAGSTVRDLLAFLKMPTEARGISFINGELSAMPNLQPDLDHPLKDNDRVAFFDLHSMWPFQYRHGIPMVGEMSEAMQSSQDQGLHHAYKQE